MYMRTPHLFLTHGILQTPLSISVVNMTHARRDQLDMHRTKRTRHDHHSTILSLMHNLHSKLALHVPFQPATDPALAKAIPKADRNRGKKANAKQRGSPLIVIHDGPTFANLTHAPQVQQRAVH
jgi:hypothetical protein